MYGQSAERVILAGSSQSHKERIDNQQQYGCVLAPVFYHISIGHIVHLIQLYQGCMGLVWLGDILKRFQYAMRVALSCFLGL